MRAIDADVLLERTCELEAQALSHVEKIIYEEEEELDE